MNFAAAPRQWSSSGPARPLADGNTIAIMRRTESIRLLVTAEEKARIGRAAAAAKRTMSDWLRVVAEERIEGQFREEEGTRESGLESACEGAELTL